ncbi:MAG: hypothetical protein K2I05_00905 [Mailhella sp.]|nr:hypothetical protein [Mailhella sp.]
MADTIVDRIFVAIGLKTDDVQKGMTKAEKFITKGINNIKSTLMPLATGFALASMVTGFVEGANQIEKASQRLGMTTEDLQAWQGAAEALGAEGAEVNEMLSDMNEHLVDMVQFGSGPAVDILNKLGISAKDAAGKIRPAADVLLDLAGASEKVGKQNMLAYGKMMGFNPEVIDLLLQGRKGLEDLLKAQKELAVFNKEDAEIAKQSKIAWQGFMKSLQAIQAVIMRAVMPALVTMVHWLTKAVVWARQNQPFIIALITGLALLITKMLIPAMLKMGAAGLAAMAPLLPLIALITLLALAVDDFWTYLEGGEAAFGGVWAYMIKFFSFFETSIDGAKKWWKNACEFWAAIWSGTWDKAGKSFIGMFEGVIQLVYGLFEGLGFYILDLINNITGGAVDKVKAEIAGFFNWVSDKWNNFTSWFSGNDAGFSVSQEQLVNASVPTDRAQNNTITSSTSVGNITINTQATDASGIAKSINPAIQQEFSSDAFVMAANTGVILK